jgi:hypothetical protein
MPQKLFRFITRLFLAVAILLGFGTSSLHAQQAGVLLGYGGPTDHGGPGYQTAWIVFSATEAHVVVTVPDIIVPRSTGFWRVGTYIACEYFEQAQDDSAREVIWQTPMEKAPIIKQDAPCKSHKPGDVDNSAQDSEGPPDPNKPSDSADAPVQLCRDRAGSITFVSPTYVSEDFDDVDTCDPRGGHDQAYNDVRSLDSADPVSLSDVFPEGAAKAYALAARKGFAENSKEFNCPPPYPDKYDLKSWNIQHVKGAWAPFANLDQWQGQCAFPYQIDLQLPKSVSGEVPKAGAWKAFASAIPHLSDFFLSPLGDFALVLVQLKNGEFHLYAYSVQAGVPAKQLAEIPGYIGAATNAVVMAQWCSGKYVPQWTAVLQQINDHPLPAPVPQLN